MLMLQILHSLLCPSFYFSALSFVSTRPLICSCVLLCEMVAVRALLFGFVLSVVVIGVEANTGYYNLQQQVFCKGFPYIEAVSARRE